jgi:ribosomal protein S18 acetylase RimI-like enzyme
VISYVVDVLTKETYRSALRSFIKAMGFVEYYGDEEEIEEWIANSIKMFYKADNFHCVGVRSTQSTDYIGFSSLIPVDTSGWIPYVGIDPHYQGRGLGKKLMEKILEIAKELNLKTIELCSSRKGIYFYQSLGFKIDYPVNGYDILESKKKPQKKLQIATDIPDWIYKMDREVVGVDRSKLLHIHNYKHVTVINEPNHGYGFLYKTRIGPIVADSIVLAQEIILKGMELGGTSLVLVENSDRKKKISDVVTLKLQKLMDNTKMTYGIPLQQNLDKLYGFRSVAYG